MENVWNSSRHILRNWWPHLVDKLDCHWSFHSTKLIGLLAGIICLKVSHVTCTHVIFLFCILGATLFLTPEYELTLDPDDSIALNPNEIPLVTFRKRITSKLGKPYGSCRIGFSNVLLTMNPLSISRISLFYHLTLSVEPWEYPLKISSSKWTYTFWTLYKETVHVPMFDRSYWNWMQLFIDFIPTESKWIFAPSTMHIHTGHLKITAKVTSKSTKWTVRVWHDRS